MSKISEQLSEALARFTEEHDKFEAGNKAAGTRARKALMEIKQIASEGRKEISTAKSSKESQEKEA